MGFSFFAIPPTLETALFSALTLVFTGLLLWYFVYKKKIEQEKAPRYQLLFMEVGKPELSLLPTKSKISLHFIVELLFILTTILVVYRVSLLTGRLYSFLAKLIPPLSFLPTFSLGRPLIFVLFLFVLFATIVLYLSQRGKSWRIVSVLVDETNDKKADYFIKADLENPGTTLHNIKDLMFDLYAPTFFLLVVNSQLDGDWGHLTKAILQGVDGEEGICDSFTKHALLMISDRSVGEAGQLFPGEGENQVFFIPYSIDRLGGEERTASSLRLLTEKLARFTCGQKSHTSGEYMGRYAFHPEKLNLEIEGRYLIPSYPSKEFVHRGMGLAEIVEKMIQTQTFVHFSPEKIRQVFVFDVISVDIESNQVERDNRQGRISSGIGHALGKKPGEIKLTFRYLIDKRAEPPLLFLITDAIVAKKKEKGEGVKVR